MAGAPATVMMRSSPAQLMETLMHLHPIGSARRRRQLRGGTTGKSMATFEARQGQLHAVTAEQRLEYRLAEDVDPSRFATPPPLRPVKRRPGSRTVAEISARQRRVGHRILAESKGGGGGWSGSRGGGGRRL
jgi:hypothetical protein